MGFEAPRRTLRLVFEDAEMAGAEVVCRSVSLDEYLGFLDLAQIQGFEELRETLTRFGDSVVQEWNLTADGKPVEASGKGLLSLDTFVSRNIYGAWVKAMSGLPGPLGQRSTNGVPSVVQSAPMETLSESRSS